MTQKIPPEIRAQVLTLWLQAFSRDGIAKDLGIATGTASEIIKSYKKHDPEFELAREYVLALKGQGSNIDQFASSIRLQRLLERFDVAGEQIESFVKDATKYCFLKGMDVKKFIELAHEVSILSEKSGIDLQKLPAQIQEKERELYLVTMDLSAKKAEREQALRECDETKALLDELKRKKVQTSKELRNLQEIKALGEDTLIRSLAYYIRQWSWEKNCPRHSSTRIGRGAQIALFYKVGSIPTHQSK